MKIFKWVLLIGFVVVYLGSLAASMSRDSSFSNRNHPELKKGEIWLGNYYLEKTKAIGWESKRVGSVAYKMNGETVYYLVPVFVQRMELHRAGVGQAKPGFAKVD